MAAKPTVLVALILILQPLVGSAQVPAPFPGAQADPLTSKIQEQAEEIFERGEYDRAYPIYRDELAPKGDKFSQYMVGYMHLYGKGVPKDKVIASAWYRLAAERGNQPKFIEVRDELMGDLNAAQREASDREFVRLRKQFGDLTLLMNELRSEYRILKSRTGSKVGSDSIPMTVIDSRRMGAAGSGVEFYGRIEKSMKYKLDYIANHYQIEVANSDPERLDIDELEKQVERSLDKP